MSKKHNYFIKYQLPVNGEYYPREITITGVITPEQAEQKLRSLCKVEIIIISIERL